MTKNEMLLIAIGRVPGEIVHWSSAGLPKAFGLPWHVTGYHPAYRFTAPQTLISTLERAYRIGKESGLEYAYIGNLPGHPDDNTYCPHCGSLLVQQFGFDMVQDRLHAGNCPACGRSMAGVWGGT